VKVIEVHAHPVRETCRKELLQCFEEFTSELFAAKNFTAFINNVYEARI
jgi:hypothetical protein